MAHTVLVPWHLIFCRARFTPMNLASERNNHFALLIIGMNVLTQIAQANSLWISNFNTERCIKDSEHHMIGYSDFVVSMILCARGTPRSRNADHTARTCERFCLLYSQNNKSYDYQTCIAEIFLRFFLEVRKGIRAFFLLDCAFWMLIGFADELRSYGWQYILTQRLAKRSLHQVVRQRSFLESIWNSKSGANYFGLPVVPKAT